MQENHVSFENFDAELRRRLGQAPAYADTAAFAARVAARVRRDSRRRALVRRATIAFAGAAAFATAVSMPRTAATGGDVHAAVTRTIASLADAFAPLAQLVTAGDAGLIALALAALAFAALVRAAAE